MLVDDFLPFVHEIAAGSNGELVGVAGIIDIFSLPPLAGLAEGDTGHILPDQYSQLVAMEIPAVRLDLHVLANHVETVFLGTLYVEAESLVARSSVEAIRPPALVEGTELEQSFAIQGHAFVPIIIPHHGNLAESSVGLDLVDGLSILYELDAQAV